jgi:hypothetical protein
MHRVVYPASLASFPRTYTATAPAFPSFSTSAGSRRTAAQSLARRQAAGKAEGCQADNFPQQPSRDTADAAAKSTASRYILAKNVPWNAAAEAAVLQFWTEQGALLPEAEVQPEQQTEQRRLRSKLVRWAAKHPRHHHLEVLDDYMARMRDAAAATEWADDPWRVALCSEQMISRNRSPISLLQHMQSVHQAVAEHGVRLSRTQSLALATLGGGQSMAAKAVRLLSALDALPISLDFARVASKASTLLVLDDVKAVLQRRVAAMQQLHPQLDVARVFSRQPSLLALAEETVASHWVSLQTAGRLSNDDMRTLVELSPAVLAYCSGVVGWKIQQLHAYQSAKTGNAGSVPLSGMSRVLTAAPHWVWRLCYLAAAGKFKYVAVTWVRMEEDRFAFLNPGYSSWLASHPVPPEAYREWNY